jgi:hypothetical protein
VFLYFLLSWLVTGQDIKICAILISANIVSQLNCVSYANRRVGTPIALRVKKQNYG